MFGNKLLPYIIVITALYSSLITGAYAQTCDIVDNPCITSETSNLYFGLLGIDPSGATIRANVQPDGSFSGNNVSFLNPTTSVPSFSTSIMSGDDEDSQNRTQRIRITFNSGSTSGLSLSRIRMTYNGQTFNINDGATRTKDAIPAGEPMIYGGRLEIPPTITPGNYLIPYTITACYNRPPNGCTVVARNAEVDIAQTINLSSVQDMDFKTVLLGTAIINRITMATDGTMAVTAGDVSLTSGTNGDQGIIAISGEPNQNLRIRGRFQSSDAGVTMNQIHGRLLGVEQNINNFQTFNLSSSPANLEVGGRLVIRADQITRKGLFNLNYEVIVEYE